MSPAPSCPTTPLPSPAAAEAEMIARHAAYYAVTDDVPWCEHKALFDAARASAAKVCESKPRTLADFAAKARALKVRYGLDGVPFTAAYFDAYAKRDPEAEWAAQLINELADLTTDAAIQDARAA